MPAIACPVCDSKLKYGDKLAGRTVSCPKCLVPVLLPVPHVGKSEFVPDETVDEVELLPDEQELRKILAEGEDGVEFRCPHCSDAYVVSEDLAEKVIRCRNCYELCRVPSLDSSVPILKFAESGKAEKPRYRPASSRRSSPPVILYVAGGTVVLMGLFILLMICVHSLSSSGRPSSPPLHTPPAPIPSEVRDALAQLRRRVRALADGERKLREMLPLRQAEAEEEVRRQYPGPENILAQAALLDISREIRSRKTEWRESAIQEMARIGGACAELRRRYPDNEPLREEILLIISELKVFEHHW